jgi:hypothetical protein
MVAWLLYGIANVSILVMGHLIVRAIERKTSRRIAQIKAAVTLGDITGEPAHFGIRLAPVYDSSKEPTT